MQWLMHCFETAASHIGTPGFKPYLAALLLTQHREEQMIAQDFGTLDLSETQLEFPVLSSHFHLNFT